MKTLMSLTAAVFAMLVFAGCEQTPQKKQAEAIRQEAKDQANTEKRAAEEAAEAVRNEDPAGKNLIGHAKTDSVEQRAEDIEAQGKEKAKEIKAEGEQKAESVEKTQRQ